MTTEQSDFAQVDAQIEEIKSAILTLSHENAAVQALLLYLEQLIEERTRISIESNAEKERLQNGHYFAIIH